MVLPASGNHTKCRQFFNFSIFETQILRHGPDSESEKLLLPGNTHNNEPRYQKRRGSPRSNTPPEFRGEAGCFRMLIIFETLQNG